MRPAEVTNLFCRAVDSPHALWEVHGALRQQQDIVAPQCVFVLAIQRLAQCVAKTPSRIHNRRSGQHDTRAREVLREARGQHVRYGQQVDVDVGSQRLVHDQGKIVLFRKARQRAQIRADQQWI